MRLPGMEILGFYDEPYRVRRDPATRRRPAERPGPMWVQRAARPSRGDHSLVQRLKEATNLDASILDWKPSVVARRKLGGRQVSTATMIATLLVAAAVSALLWLVIERPGQVEAAAVSALHEDVAAVVETLPTLQGLARTVGALDPPDLVASSTITLAADNTARQLFGTAARVPDSDESARLRAMAVSTSGDILDVIRDLNRLIAYRAAAQPLLDAPPLPVDPEAVELAIAVQAVTAWRVGVSEGLDSLPEAALPAHRDLLVSWEESLEGWQERYLDAFREKEAETVETALAAQEQAMAALHADLLDRLTTAGASLDDVLSQVLTTIGDLPANG